MCLLKASPRLSLESESLRPPRVSREPLARDEVDQLMRFHSEEIISLLTGQTFSPMERFLLKMKYSLAFVDFGELAIKCVAASILLKDLMIIICMYKIFSLTYQTYLLD